MVSGTMSMQVGMMPVNGIVPARDHLSGTNLGRAGRVSSLPEFAERPGSAVHKRPLFGDTTCHIAGAR